MKSCFIHKRLPAFTLPELMAGMIVSALVVAATFAAFHIVQRQTELFRKNAQEAAELSFFSSRFAADFYREGKLLRVSENELQFIREGSMQDYRFAARYVLRKDGDVTDTFFVTADHLQCYAQQKLLQENDAADEVRFSLRSETKQLSLTFAKPASAKFLMDEEEKQLHGH